MATPASGGRALRMTVRVLTALFGGYLAAASVTALLARALPGSRVEASAWGMTLSFLLFAVAGLWAFHEPRLRVVTTGLWGSGLACAGMLLILGTRA
jgi:hypothetical protein